MEGKVMQGTVVCLMRSLYQKVKAMIHFIGRFYLKKIVCVPFMSVHLIETIKLKTVYENWVCQSYGFILSIGRNDVSNSLWKLFIINPLQEPGSKWLPEGSPGDEFRKYSKSPRILKIHVKNQRAHRTTPGRPLGQSDTVRSSI